MKSLCAIFLLILTLLPWANLRAEGNIVMTESALYTPVQMLADLDSLASRYPAWVRVISRDTTAQGYPIPVVLFGCRDMECPSIMIQAAMHSREYMSAQLVMAMLECYAKACQCGDSIAGQDVASLFSRVHLTIMPMANPDGVDMAQRGIYAIRDTTMTGWFYEAGGDDPARFERLKANSHGVDINRNFSNGHNRADNRADSPAMAYYSGPKPMSEVESFALMRIAWTRDFSLFLNYHCCGNMLYYGCRNARSKVNNKAREYADLITSLTGYRAVGPSHIAPNGSWADEVETLFETPSVTIETGTRTPVPAREFPSIYNRNLAVWATLASLIDQPD